MRKLFADFETRSHNHLPTRGAYNYALDPTTDPICCFFEFDDDDESFKWRPGYSLPMPVLRHLEAGGCLYFRNAAFDRNIWREVAVPYYDFPDLPLEQFKCTAYIARCNNMPAALDKNTQALNTEHKKNPRGTQLISLLSIPPYDPDPDGKLRHEMYDYCKEDVKADKAAVALMREPTDTEWAEYYANERINMRGVKIDRELARAAVNYAAEEEEDLLAVIRDITGNPKAKARGEKIKQWIMEGLDDEQLKHMEVYKGGEKKYSLDKEIRSRLLLEELDDDTKTVLECIDFAQKSSVSKFKSMLLLADDEDDRVRGALVPNGASASGRYSSRGLQFHNFPKDGMPDPEEVRQDLIDDVDPDYLREHYDMPIMDILSRMLRAAIIPDDGKVLVAGDWAAIEGRVAPWLCDNAAGRKKLKLFEDGVDTYIHAAQAILHKQDIDKDERQIGKVAELSCQFGGGERAISGFARKFKLKLSLDERLGIRDGWRAANPWAKPMWKAIEKAMLGAIKVPGTVFKVGRLKYYSVERILNKPQTLFCELPSGRVLTYPDVVVRVVEGKYGLTTEISALRATWSPKKGETEWPRGKLYGALTFENAVQATAGDLLRECIADDDEDIIFHVHDELVAEVPEIVGADCREGLEQFMDDPPWWAVGLPLKTKAKVLQRYGK